MSAVKTLEDLQRMKELALQKRSLRSVAGQARVTVAMGTCGIAAGARETMKAILRTIEEEGMDGILVTQTGCAGKCEWEPMVEVALTGGEPIMYGKVSPERARRVMQEHVAGGKAVSEWVVPRR